MVLGGIHTQGLDYCYDIIHFCELGGHQRTWRLDCTNSVVVKSTALYIATHMNYVTQGSKAQQHVRTGTEDEADEFQQTSSEKKDTKQIDNRTQKRKNKRKKEKKRYVTCNH